MVEKLSRSLFDGDRVKEFKVAVSALVVLILMIVAVFVASLLFRSEGFTAICEEVQGNNAKLSTYLVESEGRAIKRVVHEEAEGKTPVSSVQEIQASFAPVIRIFKPNDC